MASSPSRRPTCRAYTLLEMLIVVAVLVAVVSVAWPAMRRPAAKSMLRDAAKQLRVALTRARLEAIRSGTAQQFRYQPDTGYFEVSARSTSGSGGGFMPVAFQGVPEDESAANDPASNESAQHALPGGARFCDPSAPDAPPVEPDPVASHDNRSWSAPIVFYPNGRTFNARIRLQGRYEYYVDVTLRGLTGAAQVGQIQRLEQPLQQSSQPAAEESR